MMQVEDGFGGIWVCAHNLEKPLCGLHVVRPGKARCPCMGGVEGLMRELQLADELLARAERSYEADGAETLRLIRFELAALVADPKNPDWMPALTNGNPADAECLNRAYSLCAPASEEGGTNG